jgi:starch-binding outer membrane protein, SusD/RagB family
MKILKIYSLLIISLFMSRCGFLEETSPNDLDAATAISNGASAQAALIGCYSSLQNGSSYGGQFALIAESCGGNAQTGGYNYISLDQLGAREVTPANLLVEELWAALYRTITNTNRLLNALPNINDLPAAQKKDIEGQARAIRAMVHFDILRYFGEHWNQNSALGIPIIQTTQTLQDAPNRATVSANYAAIISDLSAALTLIDPTHKAIQFITKSGVNSLLSRVYLYKGDKVKAAAHATEVINTGDFALVDAANYKTIFDKRLTSESIFELKFDNQNRSAFNALTYGRDSAIRSEISFIADTILNAFFQSRAGDKRADLLDFVHNNTTILPSGRTQKYRGEEARDNSAYMMRFAEMYLIRAEANGRVAGLADLNLIRVQRGLTALTAADVPTDAAYQNALLDENQAEFNFEGHRYFDLARTRQLEAVTGIKNFRSIMPIPGREIIASKGAIAQNQGY